MDRMGVPVARACPVAGRRVPASCRYVLDVRLAAGPGRRAAPLESAQARPPYSAGFRPALAPVLPSFGEEKRGGL